MLFRRSLPRLAGGYANAVQAQRKAETALSQRKYKDAASAYAEAVKGFQAEYPSNPTHIDVVYNQERLAYANFKSGADIKKARADMEAAIQAMSKNITGDVHFALVGPKHSLFRMATEQEDEKASFDLLHEYHKALWTTQVLTYKGSSPQEWKDWVDHNVPSYLSWNPTMMISPERKGKFLMQT
eukprot:408402_1